MNCMGFGREELGSVHCSPEEYEAVRSNTITIPDRIEERFFYNPIDDCYRN